MPAHPARARELIAKGKATVKRHFPFVIQLTHRTAGNTQPTNLKLDPGAKHTGIAITTQKSILFLIELTHRKPVVTKKMTQRRAYRCRRRSTNLRCRKPRFLNRGREGKVAPSLQSILDNLSGWITRLRQWIPITSLVIETAKFDPQKLENPEISGTEYQKGTLHGFTVWEYLLAKFNHRCTYCGKSDIPLTRDHVIPKASGGSDRVTNLTLACLPCNQSKNNQTLEVFLGSPVKVKALQAQLQKPLRSCATMNILRNRIHTMAAATGLPLETSTGAETKFNRSQFQIPKTHALDAAFTGQMDFCPKGTTMRPLLITATGRGSYQRTKPDKFGFPRLYLPRTKSVRGFQTGDIVRSPKGTGRIAIRTKGHFALACANGKTTINHNHCRRLQKADGYNYQFLPTFSVGVSLVIH